MVQPHIKNFYKALQTFNFLRQTLANVHVLSKPHLTLHLVCPVMEYAAVAWDPHQLNNIQALVTIQHTYVQLAAYLVMNDYNRYNSSVSDMLHNLNW